MGLAGNVGFGEGPGYLWLAEAEGAVESSLDLVEHQNDKEGERRESLVADAVETLEGNLGTGVAGAMVVERMEVHMESPGDGVAEEADRGPQHNKDHDIWGTGRDPQCNKGLRGTGRGPERNKDPGLSGTGRGPERNQGPSCTADEAAETGDYLALEGLDLRDKARKTVG